MNRLLLIMAGMTALLLVAAVAAVVASRSRRQLLTPPEAPVVVSPTEVRVKAVERNPVATIATAAFDASRAVAIICGEDSATADRYEARNKVLRSIARRSDLPKEDVTALMAYLQSTQDKLRPERVAALKNDVINLLRCQEKPAEGLVEALIAMFSGGRHPPAVLDYCIQHLGAMQNDIRDASLRRRVRKTFVNAAARKNQPYAGTALYSLAADDCASDMQKRELKRLTIALCRIEANSVACISAIQLAGERGYKEVLPFLRNTLSSARRDAVIDIVCMGSLGLLGDESDIDILSRFKSDRRRAAASEAAIIRIKERSRLK